MCRKIVTDGEQKGNWNKMMDVMLREEGEGENLRKMEDWRENRREEKKQVGKRREKRTEEEREKVWKKCLECRCEWGKYEEKERMNGRM